MFAALRIQTGIVLAFLLFLVAMNARATAQQRPAVRSDDQLQAAQDEVLRLKEIVATLETERKAGRTKEETLRQENVTLRKQCQQLTQMLDKCQDDRKALARAADDKMAALRRESEKMRDEVRQGLEDRDRQQKKVVELTDRLQAAQQMIRLIRAIDGQVERPKQPPPKVDGVVTAVGEKHLADKHLFEVSIGSDDGLKAGMELDVFRTTDGAAVFVGRSVILKTDPDRSVAQMLAEHRKDAVCTGDRVTTRSKE